MYKRNGLDLLRFNVHKQRIETSQAVEIPLTIALKFYKAIKTVIAGGGCKGDSCADVTKLMDYQVKEITNKYIIVGCHKITLIEIENLVKILPA